MLLETYPLLGKLQLEIVVGTITGPYYVHKSVIKSNKLLLWLRKYYVVDGYWPLGPITFPLNPLPEDQLQFFFPK